MGMLADEPRNVILTVFDASLHDGDNFARSARLDFYGAEVLESYTSPGCAVAEIATLRYRFNGGTAADTSEIRSITGPPICIGENRKEATVKAFESAAVELRARLSN
jgi:hypothetical protein